MISAEAFLRIPVKILVKQHQVPAIRGVTEAGIIAVTGPSPVFIGKKKPCQAHGYCIRRLKKVAAVRVFSVDSPGEIKIRFDRFSSPRRIRMNSVAHPNGLIIKMTHVDDVVLDDLEIGA